MHKKNRKNTKKTQQKRQKKQPTKFSPARHYSPARSMPLVAPDQMDVPLRFRYVSALTGTGVAAKKFTPNSAYDVDPALGSTETFGFDEYAVMYSYYRVISYRYTVTVSNCNPTSTASCYLLNTNTDPTLAGSRFDLYSTAPHCSARLVAPHPGTGSSHVFRGRHDVAQILGSSVTETDDNYRAATTGSPADLIWLTLAAESIATTGSDGTVNMGVVYDIVMNVRFYSREVDLTLSGLQSRLKTIAQAREKMALEKKLRQ